MKKRIFYFISFVISSLLMTSCLGDTNTRINPDNALSYVTNYNYTQCALTNPGDALYRITSPFVKTLEPGRFYYLQYSLASNSSMVNGIYQLDDVSYGTLSGSYPIQEQSSFSDPTTDLTDYVTLAQNDDLRLTSFAPYYMSPFNYFNDKWVFQCTVLGYAEDLELSRGVNNVQLNIVLQPTAQTSMNTNQSVMDVYLTRANEDVTVDTSKGRTSSTFQCVVDLHELRNYFETRLEGEYSSEEAVTAYTQFQYYKYNTSTDKYDITVTKVGGLTSDSGTVYGLYIGGTNNN